MILPSVIYGLFLLSVVGIYWSLPRPALRLWLLFAASLIFYTSLQVEYLPLMLAIALATYLLGHVISAPLNWRIDNAAWQAAEEKWDGRRLALLWLGISLNILLLVGFKYLSPTFDLIESMTGGYPFFTASQSLLETLLIPLGISFFCFECIAYLVDIYRGSPPSSRFIDFAAYKLFFPKLISGPIVRFHSFAAQFEQQRPPQVNQIAEGLWLIAIGTFKKLLLADRIAILVNLSFDNLERAGSGDIWLAVFAYGLQLYLDFSGYVDIARGSAIFLGFNLPQNFDFPYFSTSIADFWRRWHITLGAWLRNYLYFPLGGSRRGLERTCLNLLVVMVLAGAWHGDNWGFLIWGGIHGLALAVHRLTQALAQRWPWVERVWRSLPGILLAWLLTQLLVFGSWLFFRLPDVRGFSLALGRLWGQPADIQFATKVYSESLGLTMPEITALLLLVWLAMAIAYIFHRSFKVQLGWPVKLLLVPLCFFLSWLLAPSETLPYIYFEF
ncbi:MAG: MBOAT family protein [Leptolyngbyaceae cyanobacterium RM1_1_2]|nr:MBOAT family protein [Leptolyngbyaceae cyanobacterium RM1_1_2]